MIPLRLRAGRQTPHPQGPSGGIGRRGRLKICFLQESGGSSPSWGTIKKTGFTPVFLMVRREAAEAPSGVHKTRRSGAFWTQPAEGGGARRVKNARNERF